MNEALSCGVDFFFDVTDISGTYIMHIDFLVSYWTIMKQNLVLFYFSLVIIDFYTLEKLLSMGLDA